MRQLHTLAALTLAAVASTSCGNVVRNGKAPVFLVVNSLQGSRGAVSPGTPTGTLLSDVLTLVTSPAPCTAEAPCATTFNDGGVASLSLSSKDVNSPASPTSNNAVTITRYRVVYRRADGRNTPGVDVPYGFDGGLTGTVAPGANLSLSFELVRHIAKGETPLVQLVSSSTIISTIADVTFYGRDQVGNEINVTGSLSVNFGNFGDF